jgi:hypothetical protein
MLSALLIGTLWGARSGYQKRQGTKNIKKIRKKESERRQPEISTPHFLNQHCCVWQAEPAIRGAYHLCFWQAAHSPLHAPSFFPCSGIWVRSFPCRTLFLASNTSIFGVLKLSNSGYLILESKPCFLV